VLHSHNKCMVTVSFTTNARLLPLATGPRLDGSKSLAEQFDFSIKPYILNLE